VLQTAGTDEAEAGERTGGLCKQNPSNGKTETLWALREREREREIEREAVSIDKIKGLIKYDNIYRCHGKSV
jgi:hypothetical protein